MKLKNEHAKQYVADFISRKGGPEQVSREAGLNRQTLRQIANGRNGPSQPLIDALATHYPEFDRTFGQETRTVISPGGATDHTALTELIRQQQLVIAKLEAKVEKLEIKNDELATENREINGAFLKLAYPDLFIDREGVKIGSDSHVTDLFSLTIPEPVRLGIGRA